MHQILIVDEEEHLLWALEKNLLPERSDLRVITANDGETGLNLLRDENISVLICDIKMPGKVDGFQLILRAKEIAPDARVVIMTAFGTNRIQNLAERIGITHYIEKPFNISDLRNVVLELLDAKEGFQGVLSDLELTDIIQMLCLAKRTALLHLKHKDHRGKIVFVRGDVTHAEFDDTEGEEAVYAMLALRQGDIYMQSDFQSDARTIHVGWQDMLLEGVRRADEASLADEEEQEQENILADLMTTEGSGEIGLGMPPSLAQEASELIEDSVPSHQPTGPVLFSEDEIAEIERAASGAHEAVDAGPITELGDEKTSDLFYAVSREREDEPGAEHSPQDLDDSTPFPVSKVRSSTPSPHGFVHEPTPTTHPSGLFRALERPVERSSDRYKLEATAVAEELELEEPSVPEPSHGPVKPQPAPVRDTATRAVQSLDYTSAPREVVSPTRILEDFARECTGLRTTGLFSSEDGLALDFVSGMSSRNYDGDVLAAFFRDIVAGCVQTVGALGDTGFVELQIVLSEDVVLLRRVEGTPYIHIAVIDQGVRLGIALVMMRRFGDRLSNCF
jgi:DNA-binding response OmpR family regulator